jgi:DNA-binding protein H-NS
MATKYQDLKAKIAKLEAQAREVLKKESAGVIVKIRGLMSEYGITVQDLGVGITRVGKKMSAMKKGPLPAKYRDPVSGKTWSGKGRAPGWIVDAIKKGKQDDFLITKAAAPAAKKATPAKKAAPRKSVATKKPVAKKAPTAKKVAVAKKPAPKAKPALKAPATTPATKA